MIVPAADRCFSSLFLFPLLSFLFPLPFIVEQPLSEAKARTISTLSSPHCKSTPVHKVSFLAHWATLHHFTSNSYIYYELTGLKGLKGMRIANSLIAFLLSIPPIGSIHSGHSSTRSSSFPPLEPQHLWTTFLESTTSLDALLQER